MEDRRAERPGRTAESRGKAAPAIPPEWQAEFEAAAARPLALRLKYAFIRTYKPVMDDEPFRAFATMSEYRAWCEANLPPWLGYGRSPIEGPR